MIYFLILLDVLLNNFTNYTSYFFIIYLYKKGFSSYLLVGLIMDLILFNSFICTIVLIIMYMLNKVFKELNKNNGFNYIFINLFNYNLFILLTNLFLSNSLFNTLILLGNNLFINILFYVLTARFYINK